MTLIWVSSLQRMIELFVVQKLHRSFCVKTVHAGVIYKTLVLYMLKRRISGDFPGCFDSYGCCSGADRLISNVVCHPTRWVDMVVDSMLQRGFWVVRVSCQRRSVLQHLSSEQICQVMRAPLAFHPYPQKKYSPIAENLMTLFRDRVILGKKIQRGKIRAALLKNRCYRITSSLKLISKLTSYEPLLFLYSLSVVHEALKREKLRLNQAYKNGTFMDWSVQLVTKTWRLLLERLGMSGTSKTLVPYIFCDQSKAQ